MNDQELRIHAMQMAVRSLEGCSAEMVDIVKMATAIYEFIKGETK